VGFEEKETKPRDVYARLRNDPFGTYEYSLRNGMCLASQRWSLPPDELERLRRLASRMGYEVVADGFVARRRASKPRTVKVHPRQLLLPGVE
jgi:hypothetical protein